MTPEKIRQIVREEVIKMLGTEEIPLPVDQFLRRRFSVPIFVRRAINFGTINANTVANSTLDIPEAAVGDTVKVTAPDDVLTDVLTFDAFVDETGLVKVRATNAGPNNVNPDEGLFNIAIWKPPTSLI